MPINIKWLKPGDIQEAKTILGVREAEWTVLAKDLAQKNHTKDGSASENLIAMTLPSSYHGDSSQGSPCPLLLSAFFVLASVYQ